MIERPFSEFLRQPNDVVADLVDHDVVLRRRNAPALRLSEAEREEERDEAFDALARLLRNLLAHSPAGLETTIDEHQKMLESRRKEREVSPDNVTPMRRSSREIAGLDIG